MPARIAWCWVSGGRRPPRSSAGGAGRARRSTLPVAVSGRAASATKAAGTMYSGSERQRGAPARRPAPARQRPAAATK